MAFDIFKFVFFDWVYVECKEKNKVRNPKDVECKKS